MGKLQSTDFYKPHFRQVQPGLSAARPSVGAGCWNGDSVTAVLELRPVPPCLFPSPDGSQGSHSWRLVEDHPVAPGSVPQQVWAAHPCLPVPSRIHPEPG